MTTSSPWSLSVKRVGVAEGESYTVHVDPNSNLASLYTEIEGVTGVKANEQRLIYRGRLLATSEQEQTPELKVTKKDPQIKDVIGLCDGQTIHLVPKPPQGGETTNNIVTQTSPNDDEAHRDESPPPIRTTDSASTSSTASLLAAILGMNDEPEESTISLGEQLSRLRSARVRGRQRPNYRLQEQDLLVSDPGSMEPVRQSLMTLHTLVDSQTHPHLEGHRQWYRGQWMDVRDTVNQWLEATVVDVVRADQVLPLRQATRTVGVVQPTSDDAVSANDFEGRMRLLLEPEEGGGYRQRPNNEGVQLLLIHYNGWPHRWDEWIRSDSERIRPFRTRTRHSASSVTASPCPQSNFSAAPSTHIKEENEEKERSALLPELQRVMASVNNMLLHAMGEKDHAVDMTVRAPSEDGLPWISERQEEANSIILDSIDELGHPEVEQHPYNRHDLEQLAPLLDRLGRALMDAAPHIASYASMLPVEDQPEPRRRAPGECNVVIAGEGEMEELTDNEDIASSRATSLGTGMFSLLDGRTTNVVLPEMNTLLMNPTLDDDDEPEDRMILANDPDNSDFASGMVNTFRGENRSRNVSQMSPSTSNTNDDGVNLLGAYLAAASLGSLANDDEDTSPNATEDTSGIQGLGRLLRQRETGTGSGIDIHIHAFVTGFGVGAGSGFAVLGDPRNGGLFGGPPTPTRATGFAGLSSIHHRHHSAFAEFRAPVSAVNEEDMSIFSELYSENPSPIDLQSGVIPSARRHRAIRSFDHDDDNEFVSRLANSRSRAGLSPLLHHTASSSRMPRRASSVSILGESASPRRGSALSRIFRRALGRRSNNSNPNLDRMNESSDG